MEGRVSSGNVVHEARAAWSLACLARRHPCRILRGAGTVHDRAGGDDHRRRSVRSQINALQELGRNRSGVVSADRRNLVYGYGRRQTGSLAAVGFLSREWSGRFSARPIGSCFTTFLPTAVSSFLETRIRVNVACQPPGDMTERDLSWGWGGPFAICRPMDERWSSENYLATISSRPPRSPTTGSSMARQPFASASATLSRSLRTAGGCSRG